MYKRRGRLLFTAIVAVVAVVAAALPLTSAGAVTSVNWSTYLGNQGRTGFNSAESLITPSAVPNLRPKWTDSSGSVSAEPVQVGGTIYYGSWDGYEHAVSATTGTQLWSTYLGQTTSTSCNPPTVGVASTATVAKITISGVTTRAVFVGGGDANFYAINAATGTIIWKKSLGTSPSAFLWSSPLLYRGTLYEGVSSFGDCPLVRGKIVAINASTGAIRNTLYTVPSTCRGASVWGSPAVDTSTGDIYFGTGNQNTSSTCNEPLSVAVIQTSSSLSLLSSWQIPSTDHGTDSDFGSTPTLFTSNGTPMVGIQNKNGIYYAFDRSSLSSGPAWKTKVAIAGDCPECGKADISSSAWDGTYLYVGTGNTTIQGVSCQGSIQALDPATGNIIWNNCLQGGPVIGAVTAVPGVCFVGDGTYFQAFDTSNGNTLFSYQDTNPGSNFWGPASISNGVAYVGNQDGNLFAFGT